MNKLECIVKDSNSEETALQEAVYNYDASLHNGSVVYQSNSPKDNIESVQQLHGFLTTLGCVGFVYLGWGPTDSYKIVNGEETLVHGDFSEAFKNTVKNTCMAVTALTLPIPELCAMYLALSAGFYFTGKLARKVHDTVKDTAQDMYMCLTMNNALQIEDAGGEQ